MTRIPQQHFYINTEDVVFFHSFPAARILASGLFSGPFALALCMEECDNASQLWLSPAAGRLGLWLPNTCLALTLLRSGPPLQRPAGPENATHCVLPREICFSSITLAACSTTAASLMWPSVKGLGERRVSVRWGLWWNVCEVTTFRFWGRTH